MKKLNNKLNLIIGKLEKQGKTSFLPKATEEQIIEFEKLNDIKLPERYKEWLLFSDGGEFFLPAGIQLYGVAHKPLIDVNDEDRPNSNYIVIGCLATGEPVLCEINSENIAIYNHESGRIEKDEVYNDFFDFLNDMEKII